MLHLDSFFIRSGIAFVFGVALLFGNSCAEPAAGGVEILIRAFIPDPSNAGNASNYIVPRPGHPTESQVRLLPGVTPDLITPACFLTDHRGYSSSQGTTARGETRFTITPGKDSATIAPAAGRTTAGTTSELKCSDGSLVQTAPGLVGRDDIGTPAVADGQIQILGQAQVKNKLAAYGFAPSIDYYFDVTWSPWTGKLTAKVSYGSFPAFEMYARTDQVAWTAVARSLPTGSPWQLGGDSLGINLITDTQTITLKSVDGTWKSDDVEQRFRLTVSNGVWQLAERSTNGAILTKVVSTSLLPGGVMRIARENDAEVLTFLGFQPGLRAEILARGPKASYIDLAWGGGAINGDWYGLLVIKDNQAHLKDLVQPGTRPPKQFGFSR